MTTIQRVTTNKELKKFARFNYELYKGNPYSVPDLLSDAIKTFRKDKNPAYEFCEAEFFLAYQNGKIVGRVAAIINHKANKTWGKKVVRFGWIDFIDDIDVTRALLKAVEEWGLAKGMTDIEGPLGFTDLDAEGMLIEGFDQLSTMATIYNFPYYPEHMEKLGYGKAMDWVEFKLYMPEEIPEQYTKIASIVERRLKLHIRKIKSVKEIKETGLGYKIFDLVNEAYKPLFGYSEMSKGQIDQYINEYLPILDLDMVTLIENEDNELVCVGISMVSMSKALQKAKGKFWPFGWWHILKGLYIKKSDIVDLLLVAIKPEYQGKGVNAMLFANLIPIYMKKGITCGETNPELEINDKIQSQWQYLKNEQHKRRRCFTKHLSD